ncbi:MAG: hypothetical protein ACETWT_10780 [Thermodesulfobacteriota bacterium]|jgi:hypothetical protein
MGNLLTYQEMVTRYEGGENAFDLTLEKWVRIREFIKTAFTTLQFDEVLEAAALKVPLCLEHEDNCGLCPLEAICSRGQEGSFMKFIRAIQAYCIAGDLLPKSSLLGLTDQIISELESCKTESLKRVN